MLTLFRSLEYFVNEYGQRRHWYWPWKKSTRCRTCNFIRAILALLHLKLDKATFPQYLIPSCGLPFERNVLIRDEVQKNFSLIRICTYFQATVIDLVHKNPSAQPLPHLPCWPFQQWNRHLNSANVGNKLLVHCAVHTLHTTGVSKFTCENVLESTSCLLHLQTWNKCKNLTINNYG